MLLAPIKEVFATSRQTYGPPRIHAELKEAGLAVGRKRVARLMRDNALRDISKPRFKKTTDSSHNNPFAPNLLEQDFTCTGENQKWA
ncbi:IS3 family transposase [Flexibacterium corallicola]|uniref:IS3 family transposase n=1 Tax=Flexibacterium corallicola TaxID=3037259 RepID=UPI00286F75E8|nr:IS3 family transposase [Pseudovibrio sp. M1P-2-3]